MNRCSAMVLFASLLLPGCGEERVARVDLDLTACFIREGRRANQHPVGLHGDPRGDGVCQDGLPEEPLVMCLALQLDGQALPAAVFSVALREAGLVVQGRGVALPAGRPEGSRLIVRPFFLEAGTAEEECGGYRIASDCTEQAACRFAFDPIQDTIRGDATFTLRYGYQMGEQPCKVQCNVPREDPGAGPPLCWPTDESLIEACDGRDNDCNGRIDDLPGLHDPANRDQYYADADGIVQDLGSECTGRGQCQLDAEGNPTTGQVVCVADPEQRNGKLTCCTVQPDCPLLGNPGNRREEVCDGLDNDCDGETDEGPLWQRVRQKQVCGVGECGGGHWICHPNDPAAAECCDSLPGCGTEAGNSTPEICDGHYHDPRGTVRGRDENCDGQADEGFTFEGAQLGEPCTGAGACGVGRVTCKWDRSGACCSTDLGCVEEGSPGAGVPERCDGLDNDCDGETDEDYRAGGTTPFLYAPELGLDSLPHYLGEACGDPDSQCGMNGEIVCAKDRWHTCCSAILDPSCPIQLGATQEVCDEQDNDCDGETDEDFVARADGGLGKGERCEGVGACPAGVGVCSIDQRDVCCSSLPGCNDHEVPVEQCNVTLQQLLNRRNMPLPVAADDNCDGLDDVEWGRFKFAGLNLGAPCTGRGVCEIEGIVECGCPPELGPGCQGDENARCSVRPGGSASPALPAELCNDLDDDCDGIDDARETVLVHGQQVLKFQWRDPISGEELPLHAECGGEAMDAGVLMLCGRGEVICGCPDGGLNCPAAERIPVCSTMPGGPYSKHQIEFCDGKDDDCNGRLPVNETDPDGDGFITCRETTCHACSDTFNESCRLLSADEAGRDASVSPSPARQELCDHKDNNCNETVDEGFVLGLECGAGQCQGGRLICTQNKLDTCCNTMPSCISANDLGLSSNEVCDGVDNDCRDGIPSEELLDADGDGIPVCGEINCLGLLPVVADSAGYADVHPAGVFGGVAIPAAPEICDGLDNDCNGELPTDPDHPAIDENDRDDDGYLACEEYALCCPRDQTGELRPDCMLRPDGVLLPDGSWDEGAGLKITPSDEPETECDGIDNNCDGWTDTEFDLDNDPLNCGACNQGCALDNTSAGEQGNLCKHGERPDCTVCKAGEDGCDPARTCCAIRLCERYFFDRNEDDADGCEYYCRNVEGFPDDRPAPIGSPFPDLNCDGIDGDISKAIFVATDGDDANNGTRLKPVKTLERAITIATPQRYQILVSGGTYTLTRPLNINKSVMISGGYCRSCYPAVVVREIEGVNRRVREAPLGWWRGTAGEAHVVNLRYLPAAGQPSYAVAVVGLKGQEVVLDRLNLTGADATGQGAAASSVVLYVSDSTGLVVRDSTITAGRGAAGAAGVAGAAGTAGSTGAVGQAAGVHDPDYAALCPSEGATRNGGNGGGANVNCSGVGAGGKGGNGGAGGPAPQLGQIGVVGAPGGSNVAGGAGGTNNPAAVGQSGAVGPTGPHGAGGASGLALAGVDFVLPVDGSTAGDGGCGAGGGGGAGGQGGEKDIPNNNHHCITLGGAGGGGGSGGAGGRAGLPGKGGGASIAILLWKGSRVALQGHNALVTAQGGAGGACGVGGAGGAGGAGGNGGTATAPAGTTYLNVKPGAQGGVGGVGGAGGTAGAGAGGPSVAIYASSDSVWTQSVGATSTFSAYGQAGAPTGGGGGACQSRAASAGVAGQAGECYNGSQLSDCF